MPLNADNFLMWFAPGESPYVSFLPRPFVRESEVLSPVVWLVPGEPTTFYINTIDNTPIDGVLTLLHEKTGNTQHALEHVLGVADFLSGKHTFGAFTTPSSLPEGYVRLSLGTNLSQWLWLTTAERATQFSARVSFGNGGKRLQNIRYPYLPELFRQQFRIRLAVKSMDPGSTKEIYVESSTGKTRPLYSEPRKIINFLTPEYDEYGHFAVVTMIEHDEIEINGRPYAYSAAYKPNMNEGDVLSQGEFSLTDETTSTLHRS